MGKALGLMVWTPSEGVAVLFYSLFSARGGALCCAENLGGMRALLAASLWPSRWCERCSRGSASQILVPLQPFWVKLPTQLCQIISNPGAGSSGVTAAPPLLQSSSSHLELLLSWPKRPPQLIPSQEKSFGKQKNGKKWSSSSRRIPVSITTRVFETQL